MKKTRCAFVIILKKIKISLFSLMYFFFIVVSCQNWVVIGNQIDLFKF